MDCHHIWYRLPRPHQEGFHCSIPNNLEPANSEFLLVPHLISSTKVCYLICRVTSSIWIIYARKQQWWGCNCVCTYQRGFLFFFFFLFIFCMVHLECLRLEAGSFRNSGLQHLLKCSITRLWLNTCKANTVRISLSWCLSLMPISNTLNWYADCGKHCTCLTFGGIYVQSI